MRPELACLGDLGQPLLDVVTVVQRLAASADVGVLSEPARVEPRRRGFLPEEAALLRLLAAPARSRCSTS